MQYFGYNSFGWKILPGRNISVLLFSIFYGEDGGRSGCLDDKYDLYGIFV
jgi:hypothetical protein